MADIDRTGGMMVVLFIALAAGDPRRAAFASWLVETRLRG
jgi:hypothetical protein